MKGLRMKLVAFLLAGAITTSAVSIAMPGTVSAAEAAGKNPAAAEQWTVVEPSMVVDTVGASQLSDASKGSLQMVDEGVLLPVDGTAEFVFQAPQAGTYSLVLDYRVKTGKVLKNSISVQWGNQEILAAVPALWGDANGKYEKDRYGNEVVPEQKMLESTHLEYIKGFADLDKAPVTFQLEKGEHRFTIKNHTQPLIVKAVYLVKTEKTPEYGEYAGALDKTAPGKDFIVIEAERYAVKSDSFIRPRNVQNPGLFPYKTNHRLLNVIDEGSWKDAGQKILWQFVVETPGLYHIGFRYAQGVKQGMAVYRNIELDGKILFDEMKSYPFEYTGLQFKNRMLQGDDGKTLGVWLDKGVHTIAMEADAEPVQEAVNAIRAIMLEINDTGIDIKKLTGSSKDSKRTWDINQYMPDITEKLEGWAERLDQVYQLLERASGEKPMFALNIQIAAKNLRELAQEPKKIPSRLTKLSEGSGSAAQLLGDLLTSLSQQPLSLDRIYITGGEKLPAADANFFEKMWEGIKGFFLSFLPGNRSYSVAAGENNKELDIWVNRPIQFVEMLQQLADSDFTPKTGISVKFSVMPNEQKLILANASRTNPDAALGISNHIPYELAIRGAISDFTEFDDFLPYMSREYNLESLIPYYVDGKIYGVTETQDFYVLMYRKDILNKLKLSVPDTWDDVKEMMPELQRHSMNFFVPMAGWSGLKPFYTTTPFLFQNGGSIYKQNGLAVDINSENSIKGFELMTELFNIYSLSENTPNFYNNFRYGTTPIGVSNFSTYVTLMNAAPEIAGLWDIALSPGVKDEKGNVSRYQVASDKADIIFSNTDQRQDAWSFMKWWLSKDVQLKYAYAMQTRYGPEYMWNTANMAAFEELPFPEEHKKVILEQWEWTREIPRHPGGYMVEREISNAWTDIVMDGNNLRISVDKATLLANREIQRKLEEFGYIKDGKVVREYPIPSVEDIRKKVKESK